MTVAADSRSDELVSVLYTSTARVEFDEAMLADLLAASRSSNERLEVTGMLLYRRGRFVQVLEGSSAAVDDVLNRIRADDRHSDVRVLIEEPLAQRVFADWSMGYELIKEPGGPLPEGFRSTFDDLDGSPASSVTLRAARELSLWFRVRRTDAGPPEG